MPVVSSSYQLDPYPLPDGKRYVTETHTLSVGDPIVYEYLADPGTDYEYELNTHAGGINVTLALKEAEDHIGNFKDTLSFQELTKAQFAQLFWEKLRRAFREKDKLTYHKMVWRVWKWVQDGHLTNEQVRISFNNYFGTNFASGSEWNTFVQNRMIPIKDRYLALMNETEM